MLPSCKDDIQKLLLFLIKQNCKSIRIRISKKFLLLSHRHPFTFQKNKTGYQASCITADTAYVQI